MSFIKLERVRAMDIAAAIIHMLENSGLSLNDLRGQGYDGAATMSGARGGVQKIIKDGAQSNIIILCWSFFELSHSIPVIRNCIDQLKSFTLWIKHSAKWEGLLKATL